MHMYRKTLVFINDGGVSDINDSIKFALRHRQESI